MNAIGYTAPDMPLFRDQMNSDRWVKHADYIYLPNNEYWGMKMIAQSEGKLKPFSEGHELPEQAVIFMGTTQELRKLLAKIPSTGKYILITRDHDYSITDELFNLRPPSVKHWFGINFNVHHVHATAIPIGTATINGFNGTLLDIGTRYEHSEPNMVNALCRMNRHPIAVDREVFINTNKGNDFCDIINHEIGQEEFYRQIVQHRFNISLAGFGKDCLRTWETIALGRIPIVSDCGEMWQFNDLPIILIKPDTFLNEKYLERYSFAKASTDAARMSYWDVFFEYRKRQIFI